MPRLEGRGDALAGRGHHRWIRRHVNAMDTGTSVHPGQIRGGRQVLIAGAADQFAPTTMTQRPSGAWPNTTSGGQRLSQGLPAQRPASPHLADNMEAGVAPG